MALIIENLTKKFDKKVIFDNFSYTFSDTGIYVIVGKSGIGKTTLFRIISGLDTKYKGSVKGADRSNVSYAFQEYRLFENLNAKDNVIFASFSKYDESAEKQAIELLKRLNFTEGDLELFPDSMSGGMKQRVSLARAILRKSDILLLDEPTKELDTQLRKIIRDIILEESKKRLIIIISHEDEDELIENAVILDLNQN